LATPQFARKIESVKPDQVFSSESGRSYHLDRLIGKGGFGEVYLATPTPQDGLPAQVCVKITERLPGWLREAYFAELLYREPRALRVYDRFVEVDGQSTRYCIALEYAMHGDLGVWLEQKGAQSERFVRRELAGILGPLGADRRCTAISRHSTSSSARTSSSSSVISASPPTS
jgi:serine/threonine protein kinase